MGTATPSGRHNTRYGVEAAKHWGLKIEMGTYVSCATTEYTTVGDVTTFAMMDNPTLVLFGARQTYTALSTGSWTHYWDATNQSVRIVPTSDGIETTAGVLTTYAIPYIAFGFGQP